jgi:5'-nucleotidase/UDP-sugar diphosphatase
MPPPIPVARRRRRAASPAALPAALAAALLLGAGCTRRAAPIDLSGQDVEVTFLHTADWHSRLLPYFETVGTTDRSLGLIQANAPFGGVMRLATLLNDARASAGPRVLHVDSGDCFQGAPIFNLFSGAVETLTLSASGVDVTVIGNHEFDRGVDNYVDQLLDWSTFPVLAANYEFEDPTLPGSSGLGDIATPFALFDLEGLQVGVIGIGNTSSLTSLSETPNSLGITPLDRVAVTQFYVDFLRPLADVIVLLTHIGPDDDMDIISRTEGIDLVFGGHLHVVVRPPLEIEECTAPETDAEIARCDTLPPGPHRRVLLVHSGAFMKYLGRLDVVFREAAAGNERNGWEVASHRYDLLPVDATVAVDPFMEELIEPYQRALLNEIPLSKPVGYATDTVPRFGTSGGDSPLGNLVAEAMLARPDVFAEFSLTNSTGIRTNINAGPVTVEALFNIFPFDNTITTMSLAGTEVKELLDFVSARSADRGCQSQAQVAGVSFVMDCRATTCDTAAGVCNEKGVACTSDADCPWTACDTAVGLCAGTYELCNADADCGPNATDIFMGGRPEDGGVPLVPNLVYSLATNDFIAHGGSGFEVLERNTTQLDSGISLRDAVQDYIIGLPLCTGGVVDDCVADVAAADAATLCLGITAAECTPEELDARARTICDRLSCVNAVSDGRIGRILP